ncbi:MAG: hypothetical protein LBD59_04950 [Prevotellaceae bacterium]|jgi:hypothetical protein|nr:hypothetical protein [Prevotellaceae bacterium]
MGIVNNNACKRYSIYANPEHVHIHELCLYIENQPEQSKIQSFAGEYDGYVEFYQQIIIG